MTEAMSRVLLSDGENPKDLAQVFPNNLPPRRTSSAALRPVTLGAKRV